MKKYAGREKNSEPSDTACENADDTPYKHAENMI